MAFVDSYSFSHRFTGEATGDAAAYQEVIHQCQDVTIVALTRQFFHFACGCGHSPENIVDAFYWLADEYRKAYCGYDGKKKYEVIDHGSGNSGW